MKSFCQQALEIFDILIWILKIQTTHMVYGMTHDYLAKMTREIAIEVVIWKIYLGKYQNRFLWFMLKII